MPFLIYEDGDYEVVKCSECQEVMVCYYSPQGGDLLISASDLFKIRQHDKECPKKPPAEEKDQTRRIETKLKKEDAMNKLEDVEIGSWYWFFSDSRNRVVMGKAKDLVPKGTPEPRVVFNKVVNTDGSGAGWSPSVQTSICISDVIKKIKNE